MTALPRQRFTRRQRAIFAWICFYVRQIGFFPTVREIGTQFDISSPNGVMCHLRSLEKKGALVRGQRMHGLTVAPLYLPARAFLPYGGEIS